MPLFPIFVKLEGRPVLLVGAGPVGESKVGGLLSAGAVVTVVAPTATPAIRKLAAGTARSSGISANSIRAISTASRSLSRQCPKTSPSSLYEEAQIRGVLVNSVDDPDNCDFYYPAVVNRGDLQIAISTAGHSPALAQRIRIELEQQFGPEYAQWIQQLGDARRELFATDMDPELRKQKLHEMAGEPQRQRTPAGWCISSARARAIRNC